MSSESLSTPDLVAIREHLGQHVRAVWLTWVAQQPTPKASWLVPWEELSEADKEVDRRIGEALYQQGYGQGYAAQAVRLAAVEAERDRLRTERAAWEMHEAELERIVERLDASCLAAEARATRLETVEQVLRDYRALKTDAAWERVGDAVVALDGPPEAPHGD